jgi:hypothetical protein
MSAQVAADLRAAADVLERDGWTQGKYHEYRDGGFCHCSAGAISVATGEHVNLQPRSESITDYDWDVGPASAAARSDAALDALSGLLSGRAVEDYNDTPSRTAAEVIAALRAAADRAEAQS